MVVELSNLTVEFSRGGRRTPRRRALDDVTLTLDTGEVVALIGPNGAGKSTVIQCLLGLVTPTAGSALVFGQPLEPGAAAFRDIVYVPEEPQYHDYLTVEEATRYYACLNGCTPSDDVLSSVLRRLRLDASRTTLIKHCSKGTKQKVGLAQCFLRRPRLMILDEPFRGLDPEMVKEFRDAVRAMVREGVTVLMSSHILSEVQQLATRIAVLEAGRLLAIHRLEEMVSESRSLEDSVLALMAAGESRREHGHHSHGDAHE